MARDSRTKSELLFEELCDGQGLNYARLPELHDRQQPDYELTTRGHRVVVEVKQIEPNDDDKRFADALRSKGMATQTRNPDTVARRVRKHISQSRSQFKSYLESRPQIPAVLVVFDNAENRYTDPYTIQTALHGWEQVVLEVGGAGHDPVVIDRGFAQRNNKALREDINRHLSALATLHECWQLDDPHDRFLALQIYHNPFAEVPLNPAWWQGEYVCHFRIEEKTPGRYQNWRRVAPAQTGQVP
ncbi:MAG: hypothetical protein KAS72_12920 [Phycisphaerales bacterium]|nr:hypothetical protein [Phycisphaerales bacterium]